MSTNLAAVEPLSTGVQTALRIPVILFALAGIVLALVFARRLGIAAAVLTAIGSAVVTADQVLNVLWAYTTNAQSKETDITADKIIGTQNTFAVIDAVLITIGIGLLVVGLAVHRRTPGAPSAPGYAAPSYPPAYAAPGYGPPPPGYGPPQGYPPPAAPPPAAE
jgi:hypothetical protein